VVSFEENITPLLTQEIDIPLIKQIGKEDFVVSELHLRKPIFNTFTQVEVEKQYPYVITNEHTYSFNLPYDPETNDKLSVNKNKDVWTSLENIHEGHVANIAFSFDNYYRPEEVMSLLSSYDLTVLWMPIYMGEGVEFDEG